MAVYAGRIGMKKAAIILLTLLVVPTVFALKYRPPRQLCTMEGPWQTIFTDQGLTVYSQRIPGSKVLAFKADGYIEAPLDQIMEVMRRVEIVDEWMPDIREKFTLEAVSDVEVITYSINRLPFPFSDRELVLHNSVRLDRERRGMVLDMVSMDYNDYPVKKATVRAHMNCGEMLVRPIGTEKTEVELLLYVDPRGFIPAWLVNRVQKRLPYNFLKTLEKKAATTNFRLRPVYRQLLDDLASLPEQ